MPEREVRWAVVVHGGAKTIAPSLFARNRAGCAAAAQAAALVLAEGGSAVDAVAAAIRQLEDDPVFNAGYGSVLTSDGRVEMDAAIMDGATLDVGGVAGVSRLRNPILVAKAMLRERPVLLAAAGAEAFATERGFELRAPEDMISAEALASENAREHDTVGCVALDIAGHVAAGTSTGGLPGKHPGRIGDSPIVGCGLQADDALGAVAFSGDGESIIRTTLAAHVMQALEGGSPARAARAAIARLGRVGGEAGAIVLDPLGRIGIAHNSRHFAIAVQTSAMAEARGAISSEEVKDLADD